VGVEGWQKTDGNDVICYTADPWNRLQLPSQYRAYEYPTRSVYLWQGGVWTLLDDHLAWKEKDPSLQGRLPRKPGTQMAMLTVFSPR